MLLNMCWKKMPSLKAHSQKTHKKDLSDMWCWQLLFHFPCRQENLLFRLQWLSGHCTSKVVLGLNDSLFLAQDEKQLYDFFETLTNVLFFLILSVLFSLITMKTQTNNNDDNNLIFLKEPYVTLGEGWDYIIIIWLDFTPACNIVLLFS